MTALLLLAFLALQSPVPEIARFEIPDSPIQVSQPVRTGKYIESSGRRAVLMGREEGLFESWIYPLKIVHDLRFTFELEGYSNPLAAADLAEWITVRPESTTIHYVHPSFSVLAHVFTPLEGPGSMILLDVDAERRLTITVSFLMDLVPMWPGGLGGQYSYWDAGQGGFLLTESTRKHAAVIGCPVAARYSVQPAHNLPNAPTRFHIDIEPAYARRNFVPIVLAGGVMTPEAAVDAYRGLLAEAKELYAEKVKHFDEIRLGLVRLGSPDVELNRAVEWAKVALDAGFVCNPQLGCGQVAGLGPSGTGARPGFGWFFGGDTFINSFAVVGMGDFAGVRRQLAFLRDHQRQDGKMMHELSQSGAMIPWFTDYPYGYYHADTTPLYLIAMENYLRHSGDVPFVRESWESLQKAYRYCLSTDADGDGMMDNSKAGLGAVETGRLLNRLSTDVFLAAVSTEAHRAMSRLAAAVGESTTAAGAGKSFDLASANLEKKFWDSEKHVLSFALGEGGERNDEVTAWPAVAMVFELLEPGHAGSMLARLAGASMSTDWGVRMLSDASSLYDPTSYNNGTVWPFLNSFVSWAEFRYDRPVSGFLHWAQGARLSFVHALGYMPELLSGDYNTALDTAVPHQLFSSSAVLIPLLKGMLGFEPSAPEKRISLKPYIPARWGEFSVSRLRVGGGAFDFEAKREPGVAVYRIGSAALEGYVMRLTAALEPGAEVKKVALNDRTVDPAIRKEDLTGCTVEFPLTGKDEIRLEVQPGLRIIEPPQDTPIGERSRQVKILHVRWDRGAGACLVEVEGRSGTASEIELLGPLSLKQRRIRVEFPPGPNRYARRTLRIAMRQQVGIP